MPETLESLEADAQQVIINPLEVVVPPSFDQLSQDAVELSTVEIGNDPDTVFSHTHSDGTVFTGTIDEIGVMCSGMMGWPKEKIRAIMQNADLAERVRQRGRDKRSAESAALAERNRPSVETPIVNKLAGVKRLEEIPQAERIEKELHPRTESPQKEIVRPGAAVIDVTKSPRAMAITRELPPKQKNTTPPLPRARQEKPAVVSLPVPAQASRPENTRSYIPAKIVPLIEALAPEQLSAKKAKPLKPSASQPVKETSERPTMASRPAQIEVNTSSQPGIDLSDVPVKELSETSIASEFVLEPLLQDEHQPHELFTPKPEQIQATVLSELPAPVDEIEAILIQFSEILESEEKEKSQAVRRILEEIISLPDTLELGREADDLVEQKLEELFVELLEEIGIEYTPELIKSLVMLTRSHYLEKILESVVENTGPELSSPSDAGTREFLQKLCQSLHKLRKGIAHIYEIGRSVLKLCNLDDTAQAEPIFV